MLKQLTDAEMLAHSKRPYIARGLDQQGRLAPTGSEVTGALLVSIGIIFLALGVVHLVLLVLA